MDGRTGLQRGNTIYANHVGSYSITSLVAHIHSRTYKKEWENKEEDFYSFEEDDYKYEEDKDYKSNEVLSDIQTRFRRT